MEGVNALLADDSFKLPSAPAIRALKTGECVLRKIQEDPSLAASFEDKLKTTLASCLLSQRLSQKVQREKL